jgi:hypothetical protein
LLKVGCRCGALGDAAASVTYSYKPAQAFTPLTPLGEGAVPGAKGLSRVVTGLLLLAVLVLLQGVVLWTLHERQRGHKAMHAAATGEAAMLRDYARRLISLPGMAELHNTHTDGSTRPVDNPMQTLQSTKRLEKTGDRAAAMAEDGEETVVWFQDIATNWLSRGWREFVGFNEYRALSFMCTRGARHGEASGRVAPQDEEGKLRCSRIPDIHAAGE